MLGTVPAEGIMSFLASPGSGIELGVNIDHVATLRNARGTPYPDPVEAALQAEQAGADAITLHLREDRRHIRDEDLHRVAAQVRTRVNLESAVTPEMLDIACRIRPHDVCLVPERREEITTEGGLDVVSGFEKIRSACIQLAQAGIRVSLFIDAKREQIDASAAAGASVIEIHTGPYAEATEAQTKAQTLENLKICAGYAQGRGLKVNAGHGLHYDNVEPVAAILEITELNIGHAIVAHALFCGWQNAVRQMKASMVRARLHALGVVQ